MPARRGFCWCLGGSAPPEISYDRAVNGGMALKPIQLDLPMPEDEAELNATFSELVVSRIGPEKLIIDLKKKTYFLYEDTGVTIYIFYLCSTTFFRIF